MLPVPIPFLRNIEEGGAGVEGSWLPTLPKDGGQMGRKGGLILTGNNCSVNCLKTRFWTWLFSLACLVCFIVEAVDPVVGTWFAQVSGLLPPSGRGTLGCELLVVGLCAAGLKLVGC